MDISSFLEYGSFGLLAAVLYFVGTRIVKSIDELKVEIQEEKKSQDRLAKLIGVLILQYKHPTLDLRDETTALLHDEDDK